MPEYTFLFFCLKVRVLANRILRAQQCFWTISLPLPSTMLESSVQRFCVLSSPEEKNSRLLLRLEWGWDLASMNCWKGPGLLTTSQHQSANFRLPPSLQFHKCLVLPIPKSLGDSEIQIREFSTFPITSLGFTFPRFAKLVTTCPYAFHLSNVFVWPPLQFSHACGFVPLKKKIFILVLVVWGGRKNWKRVFNLPSLPRNLPIPFLGSSDRKFPPLV